MTNQAQIDDVYQQGFQAGAASRDAEIEVLQSNQANVEETHKLTLREVQRELMRLQTENDQLRAQINALRDVVKVVETDYEEVLDFDECTAMCVQMDAYHGLIEAFEATQEQSITTYRNKVIEECASYCDERAKKSYLSVEKSIAAGLRAMKDQP